MKLKSLLALFAVLLLVSCDEEILEQPNLNEYNATTYFSSPPQLNEAVVAQYSTLLLQGMYSRDYYFMFDLLGNDAQPGNALLGDLRALATYQHGPQNPQVNQMWEALYRISLRSNFTLERLDDYEVKIGEEDLINQYRGESLFFRGYTYGKLARLWGDVPYRGSYDEHLSFNMARTPVADVWAAVEADLTEAIDLLPDSYDGASAGRATSGAARALLGRYQMWQGDYEAARATLEPLGPNGAHNYALVANFDDQFSETNGQTSETIFDINHVWTSWSVGNKYYMFGGQEGWGGTTTHTGRSQEYGFNDWNNVTVSLGLVNTFTYEDESGQTYVDPRAGFTFYGDAASGGDTDFCANDNRGGDPTRPRCTDTQPYNFDVNGYNWRKYNRYEYSAFEGEPDSEINTQILRYADVLLMLAEAYIETGRVAEGIETLNIVRARSGAFTYENVSDQSTAREIVRRERRLELAGEQSHWFDVLRWFGEDAKQVIDREEGLEPGTNTAPFQPRMVRFPIPQGERDGNPLMVVENDWN
ncbi:RagB/SusD family nutrient uptake outer membrane protein [Lewinella sp. 4G2]|uniref:RagB/SusD family nutrient uptake outer membrane protein n=1 Tax=Lewinella sp. 4G2 TaxID=1803372 RepID=UPI0007B4F4EC|nr:RagB/SusD family nutrient uptake outer membrane protein [Lewinella sp. 4G2]OAV45951.1 hypothetical protein A3850_018815 [Lewinella sp. 4G2]